VTAPGEITLTVNGQPVPVAQDGSFRIRQRVDVGRSKLILAVEGSHGDKAEHRVLVRRTTAVVTESIEYGTYYALIIGNNDYQTLGDLKMASSDAEAMAELLRERYGLSLRLTSYSGRNWSRGSYVIDSYTRYGREIRMNRVAAFLIVSNSS
jgi:hypothetical protein